MAIFLCSFALKDLLLNNIKHRHKNKNPLTAKHLHSSFNDSNIYIYINDQLTHYTYNKKLLWTFEGTVFILNLLIQLNTSVLLLIKCIIIYVLD